MTRAGLAFAFAVCLTPSAPAVAAPCKTQGTTGAAVLESPDTTDLTTRHAGELFSNWERSVMSATMVRLVKLPVTCDRGTVATALGDYVLTGENGDALPRRAMPAAGKDGPVVYLASPDPAGAQALRYLLVVRTVRLDGGSAVVKQIYSGIPDDQTLLTAVKAALADKSSLFGFGWMQ